MEKKLQQRLDEILDSTVEVRNAPQIGEAVIEQMRKIDSHFQISDPSDLYYVVRFYQAAQEHYDAKK